MAEENKNTDLEGFIVLFIMSFCFGIGYYTAKVLNTEADFRIDFERKLYTPYEINGELYLINQKNGKTYLLKKYELGNDYWYSYKFLAKTKTSKSKIYQKDNPLDLKIEKIDLKKEVKKRELAF